MALEIERKFLVDITKLPRNTLSCGTDLKQGYVPSSTLTTTRVRLAGQQAFLTLKGKRESNTCLEYEYEIPFQDATEMLEMLCEDIVEKTRYTLPYDNILENKSQLIWEIDIFKEDNAGLSIAEIELPSAEYVLNLPAWIGKEVSDDSRYFNSQLAKKPFNQFER